MRVLQAQSSSSQLAASNTSNSRSPFVSGTARAAASRRTNVVVRGSASADKVTSTSSNSDQISRRELGFGLAATASVAQLLTTAMPAVAEGETAAAPAPASAAPAPAPSTYVDPEDAFKLIVPADWAQTEGKLEGNRSFTGASGARRTIAWYPTDVPADQVNVTLTITNTSVEFTALGSFGNVFAFGTNLVNSMDRSFLLRMRNAMPADGEPVQVAKLLDAKDTRGMYQLEYSVEKIPGPKRHLYSLVALAFNGRYNRLYTLTAQCMEDQVQQYEPVLLKVLSTFQPPEPATTA